MRFWRLLCAGVIGLHVALGQVYYVDAQAPDGGDGSLSAPWRGIDDVLSYSYGTGFAPGDEVRFKRGETFQGVLAVDTSSGEEGSPILFGAYGEGSQAPRIEGTVMIDNRHHITIEGLHIDAQGYADGIAVRCRDVGSCSAINITHNRIEHHNGAGISLIGGGIRDTYIAYNVINDGEVGIYLASDTGDDTDNTSKDNDIPLGCNHRIVHNSVTHQRGNGIAVDALSLKEYNATFVCDGSTSQRRQNVIGHNTVAYNGGHGIEISANHLIVEGNVVEYNGLSTERGGFSGIHLFDRWPHESDAQSDTYERGGDNNTIRNNLCRYNQDRTRDRTDGNGIQLDMWCDRNKVYNNIAYGNDGAGIILFGARRNTVAHNTLYANGQDIGVRYGGNDMVVFSAEITYEEEADVRSDAGRWLLVSRENDVINNIAFAVAALHDDSPVYAGADCRIGECSYALATDNYSIDIQASNRFSHNVWYNGTFVAQAVALIDLAHDAHVMVPPGSISEAAWTAYAAVDDDRFVDAAFVDAARGDFALRSYSQAIDSGVALSWLQTDADGKSRPYGEGYDRGALEYRPATSSNHAVIVAALSILWL